jgi:hypothetical protein
MALNIVRAAVVQACGCCLRLSVGVRRRGQGRNVAGLFVQRYAENTVIKAALNRQIYGKFRGCHAPGRLLLIRKSMIKNSISRSWSNISGLRVIAGMSATPASALACINTR